MVCVLSVFFLCIFCSNKSFCVWVIACMYFKLYLFFLRGGICLCVFGCLFLFVFVFM